MARGSWRICSKTQDCTSAEGQVQQAACFESLKTHGDPTNQCGWTASLAAGARGGGSCRRQQFDAMNRPAPAGSHPNKTCSKKTNIQAANSPPGCADSMWPSGGATLGYIALTATAMSSNAHVRQTIEQSTACLSSHPWSLQTHEQEQDRHRHAWGVRLLSQTPFHARFGTA